MDVLVVDDDRELCALLDLTFRRAGLGTAVAYDAESAVRLYDAERPDVVVLDVNLGIDDGFGVLREIRRRGRTPVIMLTALDREDDKVRGLELGADDYVTKPFGHRELVARVQVHLRRSGRRLPELLDAPRVLEVGPLVMDIGQHSVTKDGVPVELTVTEFRLLGVLMREPESVVPTRRLLKQVWGYDESSSSDVVRVTIHRLRRKLGDDPVRPILVHTIAGVGVMLKPVADRPADALPD